MTARVFLSFAREDLVLVNCFRVQIKDKLYDCSPQKPYASTNVPYIRRLIRERINSASVTLCLIGKNTHRSKWVDWEIRTSNHYSKRIYGIQLDSNSVDTLPKALEDLRAPVLDWDVERLVGLIGAANCDYPNRDDHPRTARARSSPR